MKYYRQSVSVMYIFFFVHVCLCATVNPLFKEEKVIELNLEKVLFKRITNIELMPDGFALLLRRSQGSNLIVKVDRSGNIVARYDKTGNGPGELRNIQNLMYKDGFLYACEAMSAFVHKLTPDLKYVNDYRIKKTGKILPAGNYIGILGANYTEKNKADSKVDVVALYDPKTFEFKKTAFRIKDEPALYQSWGNICQIDKNSFAAIFSNDYQITIFDREMQPVKKIIEETPPHIFKYSPYKGNPNHIGGELVKWSKSWSVISDIFFVDNKFIIKYHYDKDVYLDILDKNGSIIVPGHKVKDKFLLFVEHQKYAWHYMEKIDGENETFYLIKSVLNLENKDAATN